MFANLVERREPKKKEERSRVGKDEKGVGEVGDA
jgi:hypothetical protein